MAQTKRKKIVEKHRSSVAPSRKVASKGGASTTADSLIVEEWRQEIEALSTNDFSSVDEAISALADTVAKRMGGGEISTDEARNFIIDLIQTDPELKEELGRSVRIKRR